MGKRNAARSVNHETVPCEPSPPPNRCQPFHFSFGINMKRSKQWLAHVIAHIAPGTISLDAQHKIVDLEIEANLPAGYRPTQIIAERLIIEISVVVVPIAVTPAVSGVH